MSNYFWTPQDEEKLKDAYARGGPKDGLKLATEALPDVKRGTLATKACRLGITSPKPRKNARGGSGPGSGSGLSSGSEFFA